MILDSSGESECLSILPFLPTPTRAHLLFQHSQNCNVPWSPLPPHLEIIVCTGTPTFGPITEVHMHILLLELAKDQSLKEMMVGKIRAEVMHYDGVHQVKVG